MDPVAQWLYRRFRRHAVLVFATVCYSLTLGTIMVPATAGIAIQFELAAGEVLAFLGLAALLGAVSLGGCVLLSWNDVLLPIHRWTRGDRREPAIVWRALHRAPKVLVLRLNYFLLPAGVVHAILSSSIVDAGAWTTPVFAVGAIVILLACGGFGAVGLTLLVGPIAAEIAADAERLGQPLGAVDALSVRSRIVIGAGVSVILSGHLIGVAATRGTTALSQFAASLAVGAAVASYAALLFNLGFAASVAAPIRSLQHATARVADGDFSEPAPVTNTDEIGQLAMAFNRMQRGLAERARLQDAFGAYVDPALTSRLIEQGDALFRGESVEATVFFVDVRDFTAFAESAGPEATVARLNELFEILVPPLHEHAGHANKYTGDGLLAVFGVPGEVADHAGAAVAAAKDIVDGVAERFGDEVRVGIGINTGPVIAGTIGGGGKLEFTLVGDTVNVAARVERLTKETGSSILLTKDTVDAMADAPDGLVSHGRHPLRGKASPIEVYALTTSAPAVTGAG